MMTITKAATTVPVAVLALVWTCSSLSAQQSSLSDRIAAGVQAIEGACAADVNKFCANVTRGEGRVLVCMQAHDDQLSRGCQMSLYRASRNLERALNRVERIADACGNELEAQCGNADRIGQCVMEKAASFSQPCQNVIAGLRQIGQGLGTTGGR
jgi:Cysteine rich repeat